MMLNQRKYSRGITLIEVLVTVVVLAFGLLGLAGLQGNSLRNNHSAYLRSQATYLAYEAFDRMRANRVEAVDNENYDIALSATTPKSTGSTMTKSDVSGWKTSLGILPLGDGSIDCDATSNVCTVIVQWDDSRGASAAQQFSMSAEL